MLQIPTKIYYEKATGNVLVATCERQGFVEETTIEQDMQEYLELQGKNINDIDVIELEFGTRSTTLDNAKLYKINLETKQLEVTYYTQEELNTIQQQAQQNEDLESRISDISTYLNINALAIDNVEDLILQSEQNKIINGGI